MTMAAPGLHAAARRPAGPRAAARGRASPTASTAAQCRRRSRRWPTIDSLISKRWLKAALLCSRDSATAVSSRTEIARRLTARDHRVLGVVLIDPVINSGRYRRLSRIVARVAEARRLSARQARDLFLQWRDRQATVEHLLGLAAESPHRFKSLADRLNFIAAAVARKLGPLGARSRRAPTVTAPATDELWQAYLLAIAAYVPPPPPAAVTLIASDELQGQPAVEEWCQLIPGLRVERIGGRHLAAVTTELPHVAAVLTESIRSWMPQNSATRCSSAADRLACG